MSKLNVQRHSDSPPDGEISKIFILISKLLIISPIFFLAIGYPVHKTEVPILQELNIGSISKRCYTVGETEKYFLTSPNCQRLSGHELLLQLVSKLNSLNLGLGYILIIAIAGQTIAALLIFEKKDN